MMDGQDQNDMSEFERIAMRLCLGAGMLLAMLLILAAGLLLVALTD